MATRWPERLGLPVVHRHRGDSSGYGVASRQPYVSPAVRSPSHATPRQQHAQDKNRTRAAAEDHADEVRRRRRAEKSRRRRRRRRRSGRTREDRASAISWRARGRPPPRVAASFRSGASFQRKRRARAAGAGAGAGKVGCGQPADERKTVAAPPSLRSAHSPPPPQSCRLCPNADVGHRRGRGKGESEEAEVRLRMAAAAEGSDGGGGKKETEADGGGGKAESRRKRDRTAAALALHSGSTSDRMSVNGTGSRFRFFHTAWPVRSTSQLALADGPSRSMRTMDPYAWWPCIATSKRTAKRFPASSKRQPSSPCLRKAITHRVRRAAFSIQNGHMVSLQRRGWPCVQCSTHHTGDVQTTVPTHSSCVWTKPANLPHPRVRVSCVVPKSLPAAKRST